MDMTDIVSVHRSASPDFADPTTTYLSTVTVTGTTSLTRQITATATVVASNCHITTTTTSNPIRSAASTRVYTSSTVGTPTHSSPPAVSSGYGIPSLSGLAENGAHNVQTSTLLSLPATSSFPYGISSRSGQSGNGAVSSQSSFPISFPWSKHMRSSISVSKIEESTSSSLIIGVLGKHSTGLLPMSQIIRVTTVPTTGPTRAASMSHFGRGNLIVRGSGVAYGGSDYNLSSSGPSVVITYSATATGGGALKSS